MTAAMEEGGALGAGGVRKAVHDAGFPLKGFGILPYLDKRLEPDTGAGRMLRSTVRGHGTRALGCRHSPAAC
ncbi:MAG TPA: hypothetical protein ENH08_01880 [Chromatiales bacterium]|nr:hypothetical protein [Chromatiales bacterium]